MTTHRPLPTALAALLLLACTAAATPIDDAAAAFKKGDPAAAEALLTPLPADPAALNLLSQVRLAQKKTKEAVEAAEQAVKLEPAKADYQAQLGVALSSRMGEVGFMQQAMLAGKMRKAFEQAVALDANHLGGLIGLTRYYSNAPEIAGGSLAKAADYAGRIKALNPALGETELGRIAERAEKSAEALAHYEAAAALNPAQPGLQNACGRLLVKLGRRDEARARFEAALKLNPSFEPARQALAELGTPAAP